MKDIPQKSPGDKLFSDEFNSVANELENCVTDTGQTLTASDNNQVSKSMSNYTASGDYYNDTGSATAYVLTPLASKQAPTLYVEGLRARFTAANTNTGAATVNIDTLGIKQINDSNGQALNGGEIIAGRIYEIVYDGTDFIIDKSSAILKFKPLFNNSVGLEIANNTTDPNKDIDFAPGSFVGTDVNGISLAFSLYTTLIKQIDANWAAGTNQGGFPSGLTLTASTWYYTFLIAKDDGTVDAGFDTSLTAANLRADATGYNYFLRTSAVYVDGSLNILAFDQRIINNRRYTYWDTIHVTFVQANPVSGTEYIATLRVPPAVLVEALVNFNVDIGQTGLQGIVANATTTLKTFQPAAITNGATAIGFPDNIASTGAASLNILTNTQQISTVFVKTAGTISNVGMRAATVGWIE